ELLRRDKGPDEPPEDGPPEDDAGGGPGKPQPPPPAPRGRREGDLDPDLRELEAAELRRAVWGVVRDTCHQMRAKGYPSHELMLFLLNRYWGLTLAEI